MVTTAELVFWGMCGIFAILVMCTMPILNNFIEYKETQRIFEKNY